MKKLTKLTAGLALATAATISTSAFAEVSYNIGYTSDYYFRGIFQAESSGSAGIDFEENGFYVGAWGADLGSNAGTEYDLYFGYGMDFTDELSASIGFTGYYYTEEDAEAGFDTYQEVNLGLGWKFIGLEYSMGNYANGAGPDVDYDFFAITLERNGLYSTYGSFGDEMEGDYFEIGYGTTVSEIDLGIALIINDKDLSGDTDGDESLVFSIGYSF